MTWVLVLWSLRILITFLTLLSSFKSLRKPVTRQRRAALASKEASNTTLSSADRARRRLVKANLTSWVVWASFCAAERVADRTIGWIMPLYDEIKIMSLISILVWRAAGAQLVFAKVIKPLVTPYERPLDAIGFVVGEILHLVIAALLFLPRWIGKKWLGGSKEDEVPNIMKSLRVPSRPPLARELATSIETASALAAKQSCLPPPSDSSVPISHPRRAPASTLAHSTNRLPPLRTSTSGVRPLTKPTARAEPRHDPVASTSHRIPTSTARKASSSSIITSIYPSLPPPTISPPALSLPTQSPPSKKGKHRASPPRALTPPATPPPAPSLAPPTPAPPGFFAFSPAPTRMHLGLDIVAPSSRQKALSAIAGLSRELEENRGSGKKRGRESEGLVLWGKRAKKEGVLGGGKKEKKAVGKSKAPAKVPAKAGKRRAVSESDSDSEASSFDLGEDEEDDDSTETETKTRPTKKAAPRRPPPRREAAPSPRSSAPRAGGEDSLPRKAARSTAGRAALGSSTAGRAAGSLGSSTARKPATSSAAKKAESGTSKAPASSASRTKLASSVSRPSARKREVEEEEELPKPKRKARRVLLGVQRGETSDGEEDGVPVIRRRAGRKA